MFTVLMVVALQDGNMEARAISIDPARLRDDDYQDHMYDSAVTTLDQLVQSWEESGDSDEGN